MPSRLIRKIVGLWLVATTGYAQHAGSCSDQLDTDGGAFLMIGSFLSKSGFYESPVTSPHLAENLLVGRPELCGINPSISFGP